MANAKRLKLEQRASREWNPPRSSMTPGEYSRNLLAHARAWEKSPESLTHHSCGSIAVAHSYGSGGQVLALGCMVGGGFGSYSRETVAEWAGGKRWILKNAQGYNRRRTLDYLDLPESDGRLLLIGAPPKPAKGVVAWRNRWTIGKAHIRGVVAVAGEGIEGASVKANLAEMLAGLRGQLAHAENHLSEAREASEAATAALPWRRERGERALHLLEMCSVHAGRPGETYATVGVDTRNVSQIADALATRARDDRDAATGVRHSRLHARAASMLERYAARDARPLAIGVRATRVDGSPMHPGAYSDAHRIGAPATAPDWQPTPHCGNGLHYIPAVQPEAVAGEGNRNPRETTPRNAADCVQDATRYAHGDYALWIVRADSTFYPDGAPNLTEAPTAVMIDGHKAKARTLTPLQRVGQSGPGRAHAALEAWRQAQWLAETTERRVSEGERNLASLTTRVALAERTLRDWRKK